MGALDAFQFGHAFVQLVGAQEGQAVVEVLAGGVGREFEGLTELFRGFFVGGGIFVVGLAQVAIAPKLLLADAAGIAALQQAERRQKEKEQERHPSPVYVAFEIRILRPDIW